MNDTFFKAVDSKRGLVLDPRTKLFLLLLIFIFAMSGLAGDAGIYLMPALALIPLILLVSALKIKAAIVYFLLYSIGFCLQMFALEKTSGAIYFLIVIINGLTSHFLPSLMMGYFAICTTTVSEFIAAMEKMHITDKITIPLSVMFRFFPTIGEEITSINSAMRMRKIDISHGNILGMIEYRMIPMMICSVKIGEELSAAALTRGLGMPGKRTNICKIGFKLQDYLMFLMGILMVFACVYINIKF